MSKLPAKRKSSRPRKKGIKRASGVQMSDSRPSPNPLLITPPKVESRQMSSTSSLEDDHYFNEETQSKKSNDQKCKQIKRCVDDPSLTRPNRHDGHIDLDSIEDAKEKQAPLEKETVPAESEFRSGSEPPLSKENAKKKRTTKKRQMPLPSLESIKEEVNLDSNSVNADSDNHAQVENVEPIDTKQQSTVENDPSPPLSEQQNSQKCNDSHPNKNLRDVHQPPFESIRDDSNPYLNDTDDADSDIHASLKKGSWPIESQHPSSIENKMSHPLPESHLLQEDAVRKSKKNGHQGQQSPLDQIKDDDKIDLESIHKYESNFIHTIPSPTVMHPVLVSSLKVDINIFHFLTISEPIDRITTIEWSCESLECEVLVEASTVFVQGILIANIEYVNAHTTHNLKTSIPWKKTIKTVWHYPPSPPMTSDKKSYVYNNDSILHIEQRQTFSDPIFSKLRGIHFVSHMNQEQLKNGQLDIKGNAILSIDLLQEQYVALR